MRQFIFFKLYKCDPSICRWKFLSYYLLKIILFVGCILFFLNMPLEKVELKSDKCAVLWDTTNTLHQLKKDCVLHYIWWYPGVQFINNGGFPVGLHNWRYPLKVGRKDPWLKLESNLKAEYLSLGCFFECCFSVGTFVALFVSEMQLDQLNCFVKVARRL